RNALVWLVSAATLVSMLTILTDRAAAAETKTATNEQTAKKGYEEAVKKAAAYLAKAQAANGSFSAQAGPAITAVVATGLLENGRAPSDPTVAKALGYLEGFVRPDGG